MPPVLVKRRANESPAAAVLPGSWTAMAAGVRKIGAVREILLARARVATIRSLPESSVAGSVNTAVRVSAAPGVRSGLSWVTLMPAVGRLKVSVGATVKSPTLKRCNTTCNGARTRTLDSASSRNPARLFCRVRTLPFRARL